MNLISAGSISLDSTFKWRGKKDFDLNINLLCIRKESLQFFFSILAFFNVL